jgi:hypothetical protein
MAAKGTRGNGVHTIGWVEATGEAPSRIPNPDFPDGVDLDPSGGLEACTVTLTYPAPGRGFHTILCETCGQDAIVRASGDPDDPRSFKIICRDAAK